ncbi:protein PERCC1 [Megalops cyprinoides]|uniref:protein PERCC1 n=1 Tax=Megalops cyprinoides TaxID=118141 RepID=UPI0018641734|nr:protein PERCC1 [Megalops cyprinoides]
MAAGVIRNLSEFRLTTSYQHPFYCQMDIQDSLIEDEEEDEEEEEEENEGEEEGLEERGGLSCHTHGGDEGWREKASAPSPTETTYRLLRFADLINSDIQRYFGRKNREEDPDACDIYEDRTFQGKCGRERYYADLVKMAQTGDSSSAGGKGGQEEAQDSPSTPLNLPCEVDCQALEVLCSQENTQQLGPLAELFDYGLRRFVGSNGGSKQAPQQKGDRRHGHILPMCKRRLPPSFWTEPTPAQPVCMLSTSNTPDFSDLLANWTTESSQELHGGVRDSPHELTRQELETEYHIS